MKQLLLYISSFLLLGPISTLAQSDDVSAADSVSTTDVAYAVELDEEQASLDSITYPFFSSVSILYDYGKLAAMFLETESKQEVGVQLDFKNKFVIVGEYGLAQLEPNGAYQNAAYVSSGYYYRVGLGYKVSMKSKNNFVFTFRYGQSFYSDEGTVAIESPSRIYDDFTSPFEREKTKADWFELVVSSETRMWKGLYLGFHLRIRVMNKYEEREPLDVYSIPGYGRTIDKSIPALNLYVKYAIEWF